MNLEKLHTELTKASEEKADKELARMIQIHTDAAQTQDELLKRYLHKIATIPGTVTDYTIGSTIVVELVKHENIVKRLNELKTNLV